VVAALVATLADMPAVVDIVVDLDIVVVAVVHLFIVLTAIGAAQVVRRPLGKAAELDGPPQARPAVRTARCQGHRRVGLARGVKVTPPRG
jgi:hypothetical protein